MHPKMSELFYTRKLIIGCSHCKAYTHTTLSHRDVSRRNDRELVRALFFNTCAFPSPICRSLEIRLLDVVIAAKKNLNFFFISNISNSLTLLLTNHSIIC